jgi:tetratricopeptide (TPR) repeat protein
MYLGFYGWKGTQKDISDVIKPLEADRNVNVEELIYFVRNNAGWLNAEFRVGGDLTLLKKFLAAGIPVQIEESFLFTEDYWPNDDGWAAHYLLVTGYDDATQTFTGQDSYFGPDQKFSYADLDSKWRIFNRVMILIYLPQQQGIVQSILGPDWDVDANRQHALETAQAEAKANPQDAFAWFNIGSNQVYFGQYDAAVEAYQKAISIGLPQRMLRYQFGPFFAYFHTERTEDLSALADYALQRTPNSEEALLWKGWALYRQGKDLDAINSFKKALEANPGYQDAQYAIDFVAANP